MGRQILRWSVTGWVLAAAVTVPFKLAGNLSWADAFFVGAVTAAVLLIGVGAMALGGGGTSWTDPITKAARREERAVGHEEGATLTPFGSALVVTLQLGAAAVTFVALGT